MCILEILRDKNCANRNKMKSPQVYKTVLRVQIKDISFRICNYPYKRSVFLFFLFFLKFKTQLYMYLLKKNIFIRQNKKKQSLNCIMML